MSDELVGQGGGICLDFDEVDSHGGDFGKERSAKRVGKGEVNAFHSEVSTISGSLKLVDVNQP